MYTGLVQSRLCTADYALLTRYYGSLRHLNSRTHDFLNYCSHISGQGYITTNNQSVSMSWYRAQSRTIDQSLLSP
jgi:hypothetical protein